MRHKFARLIGYSNYADYAVDLRMARSSSKVWPTTPTLLLSDGWTLQSNLDVVMANNICFSSFTVFNYPE